MVLITFPPLPPSPLHYFSSFRRVQGFNCDWDKTIDSREELSDGSRNPNFQNLLSKEEGTTRGECLAKCADNVQCGYAVHIKDLVDKKDGSVHPAECHIWDASVPANAVAGMPKFYTDDYPCNREVCTSTPAAYRPAQTVTTSTPAAYRPAQTVTTGESSKTC